MRGGVGVRAFHLGLPRPVRVRVHAESGATEVERDVAAASSEALASDGSVLAHAAYVDCAAPSIAFRLAALGSNPTAELALKVRHFLPRPGQEFTEHHPGAIALRPPAFERSPELNRYSPRTSLANRFCAQLNANAIRTRWTSGELAPLLPLALLHVDPPPAEQ